MTDSIAVIAPGVLHLTVSSTIRNFVAEKRFQKDISIRTLKCKLELVTGSTNSNMNLEVYDKSDKFVCSLDSDDAMLGSYPIDSGMRIHVIDNIATVGEFDNASQVEKYEMTVEKYEQLTDSVKSFKQKNKLGRFKDTDTQIQEQLDREREKKLEETKDKAESFSLGDRCEVKVQNQPIRRGTIRYVGLTDFKPGYWVGIQYDEPVGKNDGSIQGKKYFDCFPKYGGFVQPSAVTVGDFPEEEIEEM